jgi:acyl-coenzyme A synthetase/AMP-(fatty) acid ligase
MPPHRPASLWQAAAAARGPGDQYIAENDLTLRVADLTSRSILGEKVEDLRGRSVLVSTKDQISTAVALLELDGIAGRLVLIPPDTGLTDFSYLYGSALADVVVADRLLPGCPSRNHVMLSGRIERAPPVAMDRRGQIETSWVLLTSGTSGRPKLVEHTFRSLTGAIRTDGSSNTPIVWSTFYDIRRYGGLQILLRAVLTGSSFLMRNPGTPIAEFLTSARAAGVTHLSGTPSHWRLALMSPSAERLAPEYVRLSGEIADQAILDVIQSTWPGAAVAHAFASTEAGVAFEVTDGRAGFPLTVLEPQQECHDVEVHVRDGTLCVRSSRIARRYLGDGSGSVSGADGFVDTGDVVELCGNRYYFAGRRDGVINVGGMKVHPEEVEAVINCHPCVRMSLVRMRKSPVTGSLVVADVVLKAEPDLCDEAYSKVKTEILQFCAESLPRHKVPGVIHVVNSLGIEHTGKIARSHA